MRIKNWRKFQHYTHRSPPWIKLHRSLLDDPEWFALDGDASKLLAMCWLIAAERDGELPDSKTLAFRLRISEKELAKQICKLNHWLEHDASAMLAPCKQVATTESESESESETQDKAEGESPKTKRGVGGWIVNEGHRGLAEQLGASVEAEETKFRDYLAANGKRYSDYDAAFRNWLKNSQKFNGGGNGGRKLQDDRLSVGKAAERLRDSGFSIPPRPSLVFGAGESDRRLLPKGRGS